MTQRKTVIGRMEDIALKKNNLEEKMPKKSMKPTSALLITPVVLLTCQDEGAKPNIITLAWVGVANSDPPMISVAIRPDRHSHGIVKKTGEFVANLPTTEMLKEMDFCGVASGSKVDKFSETHLTSLPAEKVKAPLIKECPVNLECRVKQFIPLGSHDLFLGEIVAVHMDTEIQDERGRLDIAKSKLFAFHPGAMEYWSLGEKIGKYGFTKGKLD
ncbi:MAG: flavin reductase family protein [Deltaproteobacteria bacterium]|nr:flavin reductase family protein [Deltaproteobacteria bacterium]